MEPFFYFLGEAYGLTMVTATVGAVIISTIPLIVPFAAYYLFREKLTPMNYLGLFISFGGVLLVVLTKSGGLAADWKGILLMFVAVLSAVSYTMVVKMLADDYTPITITAYQSFYGLLMFIPLFLIMELPHLDFSQVTTQQPPCYRLSGGIWIGNLFYSHYHWNQGAGSCQGQYFWQPDPCGHGHRLFLSVEGSHASVEDPGYFDCDPGTVPLPDQQSTG